MIVAGDSSISGDSSPTPRTARVKKRTKDTMRHHDEPSSGLLWSIIAASAVVHVTSLLLGQTILSEWRWQQYPVHSSIEMIGALIALEVARQLISLEGHKDGGSYNTQIAAALIGMGILDGAHALVLAGNCFVWLHSIATFVGGLLFSLIWLPSQWPLWHRHRWPLTILAGSVLVAATSLAIPDHLPTVVQQTGFSPLAEFLNVGGGILLLAAGGRLFQTWLSGRNQDDLLFCLHCSLFGAAAIMFEQSTLWDLPWWGWHILRLMAYLVAYLFVLRSHARAYERQITMRRELQDFQTTLDAAPVGILIADDNGLIKYANSSLLDNFGWSRDRLLGQPVEALIPAPLKQRHVAHRESFMKQPVQRLMQTTGTLFAMNAHGHEFPVEVGLSPLPLVEGTYVLATVSDISDRWKAEQERDAKTQALAAEVRLRQQSEQKLTTSNEALQQFAYAASHDMQEPLRAIAGYCELLQEQYGSRVDDRGRGFIQHAVDGAHRLQQLIEDLLEYSRVNTRGDAFATLETHSVVDEALSNLSQAVKEASAEVIVNDLPPVLGDRSQLVRVFQNLIGNAIKFQGERPPKITVSGRQKDDKVALTVCDNGIGIPPEYRNRIFMIFQRLHTRKAYPGTGMGLAICKHIIDRHGGRITVEPADGGGSLFTVHLQAAIPAEIPTPPPTTATSRPAASPADPDHD
jgi:PAS domain S-box-containing protein